MISRNDKVDIKLKRLYWLINSKETMPFRSCTTLPNSLMLANNPITEIKRLVQLINTQKKMYTYTY